MRPASPRVGSVRVEHGNEGLSLIAFMHDVQHVPRIAPEPVKTCDDELVTVRVR